MNIILISRIQLSNKRKKKLSGENGREKKIKKITEINIQ